MMGNVVGLTGAGNQRCGRAVASRAAVGIDDVQIESTGEKSPGDAGGVEQVADVLATHLHQAARGCGTGVADRIGIAVKSQAAVAIVFTGSPFMSWMTPLVWPEIRLRAPGVEGPKLVS